MLTATETESQPEVKIEEDLSNTTLCSLENDFNNSKISHEVCKNIMNLFNCNFCLCITFFISYFYDYINNIICIILEFKFS